MFSLSPLARTPGALLAAVLWAGCAATLPAKMSYVAPETVPVTAEGLVALPTGEILDVRPLLAADAQLGGPGTSSQLQLIKLYGVFFVAGDGFARLWRVEPSGADQAKFEEVEDLLPGPGGFRAPELEGSIDTPCIVFAWQGGEGTRRTFVGRDGDFNDTKCPDSP